MREFVDNSTISISIGSRTYEIHIPLANDEEAILLGRYLENASSFDDVWTQIVLEEEYDTYWMRRDYEWYFSSQSNGD